MARPSSARRTAPTTLSYKSLRCNGSICLTSLPRQESVDFGIDQGGITNRRNFIFSSVVTTRRQWRAVV